MFACALRNIFNANNKLYSDITFLIIKSTIILTIVFFVLRYLRLNIYEPIDYKQKIIKKLEETCKFYQAKEDGIRQEIDFITQINREN